MAFTETEYNRAYLTADTQTKWSRLREIVREKSFSEGEQKVLSSGRVSGYYFNMKTTMADPEALNLIADLLLEKIYQDNPVCDFVGGLEMGAIPVLNAITMGSYLQGTPVPLFWIRKKAKDHGTQSLIEGQSVEVLSGKTAIMVDDVTTTAGSVLKSILEARKNGMIIDKVISIVDRQEGAHENLMKENIKLDYIFQADDFK